MNKKTPKIKEAKEINYADKTRAFFNLRKSAKSADRQQN